MKRLGIDVGGTFTDLILTDGSSGSIWTAKVPTTPEDPVVGAMNGIATIIRESGVEPGEIDFIGHGTTIATNLIVEGKGARTALLTTKGFRDIIEIRRASRHDRADLYDLFFDNPPPLVPRHLRFEADERMLFDGLVERPLADAEAERALAEVASSKVEALAVSLLHAHINPAHEARLAERAAERLPGVFLSASHRVNPEMFEYERTSTTVMNAMLGPKCGGYTKGFEAKVEVAGIEAEIYFMQSNGGLATPGAVADRPVVLLESGPAGGVTAAVKLCQRLGLPHAITGDIGGTTFDVSLIRNGRAEMRTFAQLGSHAVRAPTIDIESIGAGGGSIAWVDEGGGLRIGPESAGANPGPACYGRGGKRPTVTDCNLILGYVDPAAFLGGGFPLDREAAERVVRQHVAEPLGISVLEAARSVRAIANALMAQAIRLVTVERGFDPREFAYVCFGGGGPVHAIDLARELDIRTVVVPRMPGLFSAFGMLVADQLYDIQAPLMAKTGEIGAEQLNGVLDRLASDLRVRLQSAGVDTAGLAIRRRADCRYLGQAESLLVDLPDGSVRPQDLAEAFEEVHQRNWNFLEPDRPVVIVNLRLQAVVETNALEPGLASDGGAPAATGARTVVLGEAPEDVPVYRRDDLGRGTDLAGPVIVEERSSCTVVPQGWSLSVADDLSLIIKREG